MKNIDEANKILKGMNAVVWNRQNKAYKDVKSQTFCYPRPKITSNTTSVFSADPLLECEALLNFVIEPWSYEIFRLIFAEDNKGEVDDDDNSSDEPRFKKETVAVNADPKLSAFNGETYDAQDDLDYAKLCKDPSLQIKNNYMNLRVKNCTANKIHFGLKRDSILGSEELDIYFDFRYYLPYTSGGLVAGGLYVFKTTDKNSSPYNHKLRHIKIYQGSKMAMFVITYSQSNGPLSTVKVKLG
jgi:hypothetical protein